MSSSSKSSASSSTAKSKKVWVGNLSPTVTEYQLLKLTEQFGKIGSLDFVYGLNARGERAPRGFAFVTYERDIDADKAVRQLNGVRFQGREIKVRPATSNAPAPGSLVGESAETARKRRIAEQYTNSASLTGASASSSSKTKEQKAALLKAMEAKLTSMQSSDLNLKIVVPAKKTKDTQSHKKAKKS